MKGLYQVKHPWKHVTVSSLPIHGPLYPHSLLIRRPSGEPKSIFSIRHLSRHPHFSQIHRFWLSPIRGGSRLYIEGRSSITVIELLSDTGTCTPDRHWDLDVEIRILVDGVSSVTCVLLRDNSECGRSWSETTVEVKGLEFSVHRNIASWLTPMGTKALTQVIRQSGDIKKRRKHSLLCSTFPLQRFHVHALSIQS